jgi:hypothetical protein
MSDKFLAIAQTWMMSLGTPDSSTVAEVIGAANSASFRVSIFCCDVATNEASTRMRDAHDASQQVQ